MCNANFKYETGEKYMLSCASKKVLMLKMRKLAAGEF
jgi:hypothetical protein